MKKTVLITGASSGIGAEFAKVFAKEGYNLVLVARRLDRLEQLSKELMVAFDPKVITMQKDLSLPESPKEVFDELQKKSIDLDVLVNNAGMQVYGHYQDADWQKELQMLQLNIVSLTYLTKLAVSEWIKKSRKGKILNVGSTGSFMPAPLNSIYCATKAYVLNFSEGIAKDLEGTGITVTTLCPGATRTEFAEKAKMTDTRLFSSNLMNPENVAKIGYKALIRGKRVIVAGFFNKIMVSSIRFTPRNIVLNIGKYIMGKN